MELCPTFKITEKYHPDFEKVPSKTSSQDPPLDEELCEVNFSRPLIMSAPGILLPHRRQETQPSSLCQYRFYKALSCTVILKDKCRLGLCPWKVGKKKKGKKKRKRKKKICLGLGHEELGFKSLFC